jgi:hypothetical protein
MNLRPIGIAAMIIGFMFKVMHWPGANASVLAGGLLIMVSLLLDLTARPLSLGPVLRSLAGVLLTATVLFKLLHWPFATVIMYGALAATIAALVVARDQFKAGQVLDRRFLWLLAVSATTAMVGLLFKVMHWPAGSILFVLGMSGCATWFLVNGAAPKTGNRSKGHAQA